MMVVADEQRARSLAGIMGGEDSEIAESTDEVVLEGANWDRATHPSDVECAWPGHRGRRDVSVAASIPISPRSPLRARRSSRSTSPAGSALAGLVDEYPGRAAPPTVVVRPAEIEALMGTSYSREQIVHTLDALGFGVSPVDSDELRVSVPGWRRFDVEGRADLAEEVGRIEGFDRIPATMLRGEVPAPRPNGDAGYADELRARRALAAAGATRGRYLLARRPGLIETLSVAL